MLSELEVCPCSYPSDPQLSRLFASSVPFWSRRRTLPTCIPECQERVFSSCPVLLLHADRTPPHLLLVIEKQEQKHECVCRALCNSREVNLSKSPALAKVYFPLQCQCFFAAYGSSTAGAANGTQQRVPQSGKDFFLVLPQHPVMPTVTIQAPPPTEHPQSGGKLGYLLVLKPDGKLLLPENL